MTDMHDSYTSDKYAEKLSREDLEKLALQKVSTDNYYDLADNIDGTSDEELYFIIECGGDVVEEDSYINTYPEEWEYVKESMRQDNE